MPGQSRKFEQDNLPIQPFPLGRALVAVCLLVVTGLAAGLVAFAPV